MRRRNEMGRLLRARLKALMLAVACGWLLLVLMVIVSPPASAFRSITFSNRLVTTSPTDTPVPPTNTPTPTSIPASTATPTDTPTSTATIAPIATATPPPDASGGGSGGGSNDGGGGGPAGPPVTRVVFSQPTIGANSDSPLQGLTPSAFGSNGLLLAGTLSCVVALLGMIIAAIALLVLIRGGYGPFLKALLRGKRAGGTRGALQVSGFAGDTGYGPRGQGFNADDPPRRDDRYGQPPARSASRAARPQPPPTRDRQGWR